VIKLTSLINESLSESDFSKLFFWAYKSIFDIDDKDVKYLNLTNGGKYLYPPSYTHLYFSIILNINYNSKLYCINNKFFYYKFPKEELKGLSGDQWEEMLKNSEKFDKSDINKNSIIKPNNLFSFTTIVFEGKDFVNGQFIGQCKDGLHSISDVVNKTKKIIDSNDNGNEGDKKSSPAPIIPKGKLVTV